MPPTRSPGRQREREVPLVFHSAPVWVMLSGHVLAVIEAPALGCHHTAKGTVVEMGAESRAVQAFGAPGVH